MPDAAEFGSGDAVAVIDARMRVVDWNVAAEAPTGLPAAATVGRRCWEVLNARAAEEAEVCAPGCRVAVRALQQADVAGRPMLINTPTGSRRVWMTTVRAQEHGGARIVHVFCAYPTPHPAADVARLTPREREVLSLLREGCDASAIAVRLGVSITTVRTHVRHILATLGVRSQLAAVASTGGRPPFPYDLDAQS